MKIQVVIGANYGDEGKGLVSGCLAREAAKRNEKTLTVFYNGTSQRAHTFEGEIHRCMAAGTKYGSDTFYHRQFVIDPISIWLLQAKPIIDGECRVILPCDVLKNRKLETERGAARHGSCGFGLFEAVKRCKEPENDLRAYELLDAFNLYRKIKRILSTYQTPNDELYNLSNFMLAVDYIVRCCKISSFEKTINGYDTIIFEGGQGLLLSQTNTGDFPHLTPSCPGSDFISKDINKLKVTPELFYVSRSYMTRHGEGPMDAECAKEDINSEIIDNTNLENEFQGRLRFGKIDLLKQEKVIRKDASLYNKKELNVVYTQTNYTKGQVLGTRYSLTTPNMPFAEHVYGSDQKDRMEKIR